MAFNTPLFHFHLMLFPAAQRKPVKVSSDALHIAFRLPGCLSCVFSSAAVMRKRPAIFLKAIARLSFLRQFKLL